MKVWVTRSQPGADRIAAAIRSAGHDPLVAPVIGIEKLAAEKLEGSKYDVCIVLSAHALHAVPEGCGQYVAVGPGTASRLETMLGLPVAVPDTHNSEGVARWLESHPVCSALLISGERGRGVVAERLAALGISHDVKVAYRRTALTPDVKPEQIDVVETGSGDGVKRAAQVWFAAGGDPARPVLVPSPRVGEIAAEAGFRRVVVCDGATAADVVTALARNLG